MDGSDKPCTVSTDLQIEKLWLQKVYVEEKDDKFIQSFHLKRRVRG